MTGSGGLPQPELVYGVWWRAELVEGRVRYVAEEDGVRWIVAYRGEAWEVFRQQQPLSLAVAGAGPDAVRAALVVGSTYIAAARRRTQHDGKC